MRADPTKIDRSRKISVAYARGPTMVSTSSMTTATNHPLPRSASTRSSCWPCKDAGYPRPTPIQAAVIPAVLAGRDVLARRRHWLRQDGGFRFAARLAQSRCVRSEPHNAPRALELSIHRCLIRQPDLAWATVAGA